MVTAFVGFGTVVGGTIEGEALVGEYMMVFGFAGTVGSERIVVVAGTIGYMTVGGLVRTVVS